MIIAAILITIFNMVVWGEVIKGEGNYVFFGRMLTWEETYIGGGVGVAAGLLIWWPLCFVLGPLCGVLWAWAGAKGTSKAWRRWGVGLVIAFFGGFKGPWLTLVCPLMRIAAGLGYGIPDPSDRPNPDKGSNIGRFWFKIVNYWNDGNYCSEVYKWAGILTRATVGLLCGLALIPLTF